MRHPTVRKHGWLYLTQCANITKLLLNYWVVMNKSKILIAYGHCTLFLVHVSCWLDFGYFPDDFLLNVCCRHSMSQKYDILIGKEKKKPGIFVDVPCTMSLCTLLPKANHRAKANILWMVMHPPHGTALPSIWWTEEYRFL